MSIKDNVYCRRMKRGLNECPKGILPSGRSLHVNEGNGGWMGKLGITRRVAFGVGNTWSLFPER